MSTVEERIAYCEELSMRKDSLDQKIERFRDELVGRVDAMSVRIDAVDAKVDRVRDELSAKMSNQFVWLVGIQVSVLLAVIGALMAG